jgi:gamma-glutamylcyclotransferase (GGCT)/AIG2-like uncharacterized protein YtfP
MRDGGRGFLRAMEQIKTTNLFVYGTLMSDFNLKIITGKEFARKEGVLNSFRKVTPKDSFPFVVPYKGASTSGSVLFGLDPETMAVLDKYEAVGELYTRQSVKVLCEGAPVDADVYVGIARNIKKIVQTGLDVTDRIEDQVESKIDDFIKKSESMAGAVAPADSLSVRIRKELMGSAVETLVKAHFQWASLPSYLIEKTLSQEGLPSVGRIKQNADALRYADNYISLAVRHMIFNQIEEKIRHHFRANVKIADEYFMHSISMMLALKYLNSRKDLLQEMMAERGAHRFEASLDYADYARKGILIADALYSQDEMAKLIAWVKKNRAGGATPLGAELEFSNSGKHAIDAGPGDDPQYDNFYYFDDFDLMRRLWKLGGHVDAHRFITVSKERTRGFLEYAFGRYMILGDLSKPVTPDPWILSNLISEGAVFSGVRPHSLHVSIQISGPSDYRHKNNVDHLRCLLMLGGDIGPDETGTLREKRIFHNEVVDNYGNMNFSHEKMHYYSEDHEMQNAHIVAEYGFSRLFLHKDYEPLIVALKGFQIGEQPRPLNPETEDRGLLDIPIEEKDELTAWATSPRPVSPGAIAGFVAVVRQGLFSEKKGRPAHKEEYIERMLEKIASLIAEKNEFIKAHAE